MKCTNKEDNSYSSGACFPILVHRCNININEILDTFLYIAGISNVKSREDLVMSGSDSSDPFQNAPFKKPGKFHQ